MSSRMKTVRLGISQGGGFNFQHEASTTAEINVEMVVRAFVNKLFQLIEIKKRRGGVSLKSLKLNKPFTFNCSGAIQMKVTESMQTSCEIPAKFRSVMYKENPSAAKEDMILAILDVVDVVYDSRTLVQLSKDEPVKSLKIASEAEISAN